VALGPLPAARSPTRWLRWVFFLNVPIGVAGTRGSRT